MNTPDCAAIYQVLRNRRGHGTLVRIMRRYSSRVFDQSRGDHRRWIAWLEPSGEQPRGWPSHRSDGALHPPWKQFRQQWLALYAHAGAVLSGRTETPCEQEPHHWGAPYGIDLHRARAAGWEQVSCGDTLNMFWSVPSRRSWKPRPTRSSLPTAGPRPLVW